MKFQITTARRSDTRARVALCGPAGSGKSYTALQIARGLTDDHTRIIVIDTENGSAAKYADGEWKHLAMPSYSLETYIEAIQLASKQADVVIVDSLSHAWAGPGGALEMKDDIAARMRNPNGFAAWREVTPLHNRLVETIIQCPCHVIATMRSKTEYVLEPGQNGRVTPRRVGMAPIQRDGLEYEFDLVGDLDWEHKLIISKSRCSDLDGLVARKPGPELGRQIRDWLSDVDEAPEPAPAEEPPPEPGDDVPPSKAILLAGTRDLADLLGVPPKRAWHERIMPAVRASGAAGWAELSTTAALAILGRLRDENTPPEPVDPVGFDGPCDFDEPCTDCDHYENECDGRDEPEPVVADADQVEDDREAPDLSCTACHKRPAAPGLITCAHCAAALAQAETTVDRREPPPTTNGHAAAAAAAKLEAAGVGHGMAALRIAGGRLYGDDLHPRDFTVDQIEAALAEALRAPMGV